MIKADEETTATIRLALYEAFEYDEELMLDACRDFLEESARLRGTVVEAANNSDDKQRHAGIHTVKGVLGMFGESQAYAVVCQMNSLNRSGHSNAYRDVKALVRAFKVSFDRLSQEVERLVSQLEANGG